MLFEVSILEENKVTSNVTANRMDNKQPYAISNCHLMCINVLTPKIEEKKTQLLYFTSDAPQSISFVQGVLQDHCLFLVDLIYGCIVR